MKLQKAVAMRMSALLLERNETAYNLSMKSGLTKQCISNILNEEYSSIKFDTVIKIADGFGLSVTEFLDDKIFDRANLDLD